MLQWNKQLTFTSWKCMIFELGLEPGSGLEENLQVGGTLERQLRLGFDIG